MARATSSAGALTTVGGFRLFRGFGILRPIHIAGSYVCRQIGIVAIDTTVDLIQESSSQGTWQYAVEMRDA